MSENNGKKIEHRLATLEANYKNIMASLADVNLNLTNHITETYKRISGMENAIKDIEISTAKRPGWLIAILISAMSSTLVGLIVYIITQQ